MSAIPHYPDLAGKVAVVTGAAAGIGQAIANALARQGCALMLLDQDADALNRAAMALTGQNVPVASLAGSVSDPATVADAMAQTIARFGRLDILVNNAGIAMNKPTLELELADWQRTLDVNLTGVFLCAREAARHMNHGGVILNMASMYSVVAAPERLAYCVSKAGVAMLSKALAIEWAARHIRVNALAPGYIRTDLVAELVAQGRLDEAQLARRTPQGRLGNPEEVADLAVFLASEQARYITGQNVGVDGGWTAYGYI